MKLQVIGHKGVVGGATFELFKRLGYDVVGSDKGDRLKHADVHFVCVPEEAVLNVVDSIVSRVLSDEDFIVIRSSILPGACDTLVSLNQPLHICHNPEFLREVNAVPDEFNPNMVVIGECCERHGDIVENLYRPLGKPVLRTDCRTSQLAKLSVNCYLSCVISYWNEIDRIAKALGVSGHQVGMAASMDPRVSDYGSRLHHKYGGRCLPKDMKQMIKLADSLGLKAPLLEAIETVNNRL